jgi:hypothetical protein
MAQLEAVSLAEHHQEQLLAPPPQLVELNLPEVLETSGADGLHPLTEHWVSVVMDILMARHLLEQVEVAAVVTTVVAVVRGLAVAEVHLLPTQRWLQALPILRDSVQVRALSSLLT